MNRTDAQVQLDLMSELKWDPSIQADQIGVSVQDGVVTLSGQVDSHAQKWSAERAAMRVLGVQALAVALQVVLPGDARRSDEDIARTAVKALKWMTSLPRDAVRVSVENGWITLTGEVTWEYQRQSATEALRHLMGVTGISNQLALQPALHATAVKADIEAALRRRAQVDADQIRVGVAGSEVTLTGEVGSWTERELARHAAWGAPGVRQVLDQMVVVGP